MTRRIYNPSHRRGMTLVELLLVISIGVVLLAVSAPLVYTPTKTRKLREATRAINAIIMRAKARAAELNRPVGVAIRRAGPDDQAFYSYQLAVIETPSPYFGDFVTSRAVITNYDATSGIGEAVLSDSASAAFVASPGSTIKFDFREPEFEIVDLTVNGSDCNVRFKPANGIRPVDTSLAHLPGHPPPGWVLTNTPVPFQIFPAPSAVKPGTVAQKLATISMGPPLELPNGIAIDLSVSGMGATQNQFTPVAPNDTTDVIIMFEPGGVVERVYWGVPGSSANEIVLTHTPPLGTLYFLVGEIDQVTPNDPFTRSEDLTSNLCDPDSLWVAIGHRTGKLTTAENADLEGLLPPPGTPISFADAQMYLAAAREFARSSQQMGGQ